MSDAWRSWGQRYQRKPDRTTMQGRARLLAQEMVVFGRLRGDQWDGLTALLLAFAESEFARRSQHGSDDSARPNAVRPMEARY